MNHTRIYFETDEKISGGEYKMRTALDPFDVRAIARPIPTCREMPLPSRYSTPPNPNIVSILVYEHESKAKGNTLCDLSDPARVIVYCDTGTVAILRVLHLNGGGEDVRQIFRTKCSISDVENILQSPPKLTILDESILKDQSGAPREDEKENENEFRSNQIVPKEESEPKEKLVSKEALMKKKLTLNEIGQAILVGEHEALLKIYNYKQKKKVATQKSHDLLAKQQKKAILKKKKKSFVPRKEFAFTFTVDVMKQVELFLQDGARRRDNIISVAINGRACVLLYSSGAWVATKDVPKALQRNLERKEGKPIYVSLGLNGKYFVQFEDGDYFWEGPSDLNEYLRKGKLRCVSFGDQRDTFFIVNTDGSWYYQGSGIPQDLEDLVSKDRDGKSDLTLVSLGPNGEYFVRARNKKMWWGGLTTELEDLVEEIVTEEKKVPVFIDFGKSGSYFVCYQ